MRIIRPVLLAAIVVLTLLLSSCSSFRAELFLRNDEKIADTRFQEIIDALDNKDNEALKNLFSANALNEADDIDGGIDYLMEFYQGAIKSKDGTLKGTGSNDHGKKTSELDCKYLVTTDAAEYLVFFIDIIVDTENPDNIGLYMLQIIKQADREQEFDWGGNATRCAGIYRPEETESE